MNTIRFLLTSPFFQVPTLVFGWSRYFFFPPTGGIFLWVLIAYTVFSFLTIRSGLKKAAAAGNVVAAAATFATPGCISSAFTLQEGLACASIEARSPQPVPISRQFPRAFKEAQAPKRQASVLIFNPGFPWLSENCLNSKMDLFSAIVRRIFAPVLGFPLQDFGRIMIAF